MGAGLGAGLDTLGAGLEAGLEGALETGLEGALDGRDAGFDTVLEGDPFEVGLEFLARTGLSVIIAARKAMNTILWI